MSYLGKFWRTVGSDKDAIEPEKKFVENFNDMQDEIELVLDIVGSGQAQDVLATQLTAGNAPDVVWPVGIKGEEVSGGQILIDDRVVNDVAPKDLDIAMVFQNYALYPHMDVFTNMAFGLKLRNFPKDEIDQRVRRAADILGIVQLLDRKPKQLSGGQRQRVAVGRAIVRDPEVFLFDEPLSNLDARLRVTMRAEISKLQKQLETTMIYVAHDQVEAMTMGDRIVIMKDGYIMQVGAPLDVYDHPQNVFVAGFIGSPPMNFFKSRLTKADGAMVVDTGSFQVKVPEAYTASYEKYLDKDVTFGIRPEDIADKFPEDRRGTWEEFKAVVEVIEPLGAEIILELSQGDYSFTARVAPIPHPNYMKRSRCTLTWGRCTSLIRKPKR